LQDSPGLVPAGAFEEMLPRVEVEELRADWKPVPANMNTNSMGFPTVCG
jgi:hypothetical protein